MEESLKPIHVILQRGFYLDEGLIARTYSDSCRIARVEDICSLPRSGWMPIGSVEFCAASMRHQGIKVISSLPVYPSSLNDFLHRSVWVAGKTSIEYLLSKGQRFFVKPMFQKTFTGFVWPDDDGTEIVLKNWIRNNDQALYCSEPVNFVSEWRFYVKNKSILGFARYDDHPDCVGGSANGQSTQSDTIQQNAVIEMMLHEAALSMVHHFEDAPIGYSLDIGVLDTGKIALVEVNDAWGSLGHYKGTCSKKDFFSMLVARWNQLSENIC